MPNPDDLRVLRKEIEADLATISQLAEVLVEARATLPAEPDQKDLAYIAYLLHGIYTGWESAMRRIATTFENRLDPARWHAQLLQRMSLDLPGIRPPVIDPSLRLHLEKLRSFRHFFRHSYGVPLRWAELKLVLDAFEAAASEMAESFSRFLSNVEKITDLSEEPET
ncbi:MAG: antitoxin [Phycisphaerae bacterium]|nr:antitoxin [Phycisphaerae bacterium]